MADASVQTVFGMNGVQVKCLFENGFTVFLTRSWKGDQDLRRLLPLLLDTSWDSLTGGRLSNLDKGLGSRKPTTAPKSICIYRVLSLSPRPGNGRRV